MTPRAGLLAALLAIVVGAGRALGGGGGDAGASPVADGGAGPVDGGAPVASAVAAPPAAATAAPPLVRSIDRRPYTLLGSGVRRRGDSDLYRITLYVDEVGARRAFPALAARAGGRSRDKLLGGDKAPPFVVWGDFGKLAVVQLLRDASAAEVQSIVEEGLEGVLADKAPPELRERARDLVKLVAADMKRGAVFELHTSPGGVVDVRRPGARRAVAATDARLARALWEIWLGSRPVQVDLRRALVDRVDLLGR